MNVGDRVTICDRAAIVRGFERRQMGEDSNDVRLFLEFRWSQPATDFERQNREDRVLLTLPDGTPNPNIGSTTEEKQSGAAE